MALAVNGLRRASLDDVQQEHSGAAAHCQPLDGRQDALGQL
jgi:hypothetical protein